VTVTHDAELAKRTRRIVHMADGRILDGTLDADGGAGGGADAALATTRATVVPAAGPIA
jgi:ABC-type lipoprotein export system ATPase subunit